MAKCTCGYKKIQSGKTKYALTCYALHCLLLLAIAVVPATGVGCLCSGGGGGSRSCSDGQETHIPHSLGKALRRKWCAIGRRTVTWSLTKWVIRRLSQVLLYHKHTNLVSELQTISKYIQVHQTFIKLGKHLVIETFQITSLHHYLRKSMKALQTLFE